MAVLARRVVYCLLQPALLDAVAHKQSSLPLGTFVTLKPGKLTSLPRGIRARLEQGRIGQFVGYASTGAAIVKWHGTSDERKEFNQHLYNLDSWVDPVADQGVIAEYLTKVEAYRTLRAQRRAAGGELAAAE